MMMMIMGVLRRLQPGGYFASGHNEMRCSGFMLKMVVEDQYQIAELGGPTLEQPVTRFNQWLVQ